MKTIKRWIRNHFSFTEKEANGFIVLLSLIIVTLLIPLLKPFIQKADPVDMDKDRQEMEQFLSQIEINHEKAGELYKDSVAYSSFNPNLISEDRWTEMGLPQYLAERIRKYISKGGEFRVKKDLLKIYGFPEDKFADLVEYIDLPDSVQKRFVYAAEKEAGDTKQRKSQVKRKTAFQPLGPFDLNEADTVLLKRISGVGSVLSARIIKFRDMMGGFVSREQVSEVYNLPDSVAQVLMEKGYVKEGYRPVKININEAEKADLAAHPYISWKEAGILIAYREKHGAFKSVQDLEKVILIDKDFLQKAGPYLGF